MLKQLLLTTGKNIKKKYKKTIVWITHDMNEVFDLCNNMALMEKRKISQMQIQTDNTDLKNQIIKKFYND